MLRQDRRVRAQRDDAHFHIGQMGTAAQRGRGQPEAVAAALGMQFLEFRVPDTPCGVGDARGSGAAVDGQGGRKPRGQRQREQGLGGVESGVGAVVGDHAGRPREAAHWSVRPARKD